MPIADRAAALEKLREFLKLLDQDRTDYREGQDRTALDDIYRYVDAVRSIVLAVDVVQFHRIGADEDESWDTARVAVLRVIGQLEHADDMVKILTDDSPTTPPAKRYNPDDEPF